MKRKLWHLFWELGVSIQAGLDDGDMAGHLNAWWDVARGRITRETRWARLKKTSSTLICSPARSWNEQKQ